MNEENNIFNFIPIETVTYLDAIASEIYNYVDNEARKSITDSKQLELFNAYLRGEKVYPRYDDPNIEKFLEENSQFQSAVLYIVSQGCG